MVNNWIGTEIDGSDCEYKRSEWSIHDSDITSNNAIEIFNRWHHQEVGDNPRIDNLWRWWSSKLIDTKHKYHKYTICGEHQPIMNKRQRDKLKFCAQFTNAISNEQSNTNTINETKEFSRKLSEYRHSHCVRIVNE